MPHLLLIRNGVLATPPVPARGEVLCEGGRIVAVGRNLDSPGAQVFDAGGLTLGPGFIDVHVHGGGGHSFFEPNPDAVRTYAQWAPRNGVTGFLISTVGANELETLRILRCQAPVIGDGTGAEALGFHLEGPFISPERRGAFPRGHLRPPAPAEFQRYQEAAEGHIRQVTLAPELPGALDLIAAVTALGAIPAMGHTDATTEQAKAGFEAGIRHVTHLWNAMRPVHQREGGPIAAALLAEAATCELICDGAHVAPEVLRLSYGFLGPTRTVVVTDNLHLAGTSGDSGEFTGQGISVTGRTAVRHDGTIVGSIATMDEHFRNAVDFLGIDLPAAFRLCAANPAKVAGAQQRKGAIECGMDADMVLLDDQLQVAATICRGEFAYLREPNRLSAPPAP